MTFQHGQHGKPAAQILPFPSDYCKFQHVIDFRWWFSPGPPVLFTTYKGLVTHESQCCRKGDENITQMPLLNTCLTYHFIDLYMKYKLSTMIL